MTLGLLTLSAGRADPRVIVNASADPAYTARKYAGPQPRRETYVVMQGHFFPGASVDRSIDRMTIRQIAETFAPDLARRAFFPASSPQDADLLIVVHWGTTKPRASRLEAEARTSPAADTSGADAIREMHVGAAAEDGDAGASRLWDLSNESARVQEVDLLDQLTDQIGAQQSAADAAQLLGYTRELNRLAQSPGVSTDEYTLRQDLLQERYFVVLKAYDLRQPAPPGRPRRSVWTLHLNMSSPGNNFNGAVGRMSATAVNFVGRTTDRIATVTPTLREGHVDLGPLLILGESK